MKELKLCFGGGHRNVSFEGPKLVRTWLDQILQLTIFTLLAVTRPCCSKFQLCILECDTSVVAALVLRHCQCNYGYLTLVDLQVRRGRGGEENGGGASGSPKFTIIFKGKQSKPCAISYFSAWIYEGSLRHEFSYSQIRIISGNEGLYELFWSYIGQSFLTERERYLFRNKTKWKNMH